MGANQIKDARTDSLKITMAKYFEEHDDDYRTADWCTIVYEDDECVIVADHNGYEIDEWADEASMSYREFCETMHSLARSVCDHSWAADYPIVFDKME